MIDLECSRVDLSILYQLRDCLHGILQEALSQILRAQIPCSNLWYGVLRGQLNALAPSLQHIKDDSQDKLNICKSLMK